MSMENFIIYNFIMITFTWFLHKRHGEKMHEAGMLESIQLHSEGKLTYKTYNNAGTEMIEITVEGDDVN